VGAARRCSSTFSAATGASRSTTRTRCSNRRPRRPRASATSFRGEPARVATGTTSRPRLDDDFNTPEALAAMHGWRDPELLRRGLEVFGLESLAEAATAPAELEELARARVEARTARTSRRATACATRSMRQAGSCATSRPSPASSSCRSSELRARLRPAAGARGAARAARSARALGDRAGAEGRALAA
jgi:hypothetical protein